MPDDHKAADLMRYLRLLGIRMVPADGVVTFEPSIPHNEEETAAWLIEHAALALATQQTLDEKVQSAYQEIENLVTALVLLKTDSIGDAIQSRCVAASLHAAEALSWPLALHIASRVHEGYAIVTNDASLRTGQYL
jgi:hypothetical protein